MDYQPDKIKVVKKVASLFNNGDVVNLGIGLPTLTANYLPEGVNIVLQSENGFLGLGPSPQKGSEDVDLVNAGGSPVTILPGGCFFDSATSFGIIRGGHVDYTVLGALEVDQMGNLANYKVPGKIVPGMGGAMDLTVGAKVVIVATVHFEKDGSSKLKKACTLPLTAKEEVDLIVTDLGVFEPKNGKYILKEYFAPYSLEEVLKSSEGTVEAAPDCKQVEIN